MAIYVDWMQTCIPNKRWPYNMNCHLMADTLDELHDFAVNTLGLKRSWFQNHPRHPHYDLTEGKRKQAIAHGAVEVGLEYYKRKRKEYLENKSA